jgi:stalled ribosome rescue protein Dom34
MQQHFHMAVWIDHHEAHVFSFSAEQSDKLVVRPKHPVQHLHHKANSIGSGRAPEEKDFYKDIAGHLGQAGAVLVAGPASARLEFMKYLEAEEPALARKVSAVEKMDHPTDAEFLSHTRKYFAAQDRMTPST